MDLWDKAAEVTNYESNSIKPSTTGTQPTALKKLKKASLSEPPWV